MASEAVRYVPNHTAEEYRKWEGDWELWDGVPVCMSPSPTAKHQLVAATLLGMLQAAINENGDCHCIVIHETDWQIDDHTVVRPDISVLYHGLPEQFIDYPPSVIIEVLSPSTARKDQTAKRHLYERQGVAVYLLVDPDTTTVEALQLTASGYVPTAVVDENIALTWEDDCSANIDLKKLFAG